MRNLLQYPITEKEITDELLVLIRGCDPELIGNMRPVLLEQARQVVHAAYDMQRGIEARMKIERNVLRYCIPWAEATLLYRALRGEAPYA